MVRSLIELLRITKARGYVVHVSTPEAAAAIVNARSEGVKIWAETCPQYVFLDDSAYRGPDGNGYVCSPPLRDAGRRQRLWEMLLAGVFTIVGSDHCCYSREQKTRPAKDFRGIPNGLPGVETRCPLLFSEGVSRGLLSLQDFALLSATNPARLCGLYPRKGVLAPGSDADIVLYDPHRKVTLAATGLHMSDYTPFEGWELQGWPRRVFVRGQEVVRDGEFLGSPGKGMFIPGHSPETPFGGGAGVRARPSS